MSKKISIRGNLCCQSEIDRDNDAYDECIDGVYELYAQEMQFAYDYYQARLDIIKQETERLLQNCKNDFNPEIRLLCEKKVGLAASIHKAAELALFRTAQLAATIAAQVGIQDCKGRFKCAETSRLRYWE